MPKYKKKITRQMDYDEFKSKIQDLPRSRQAFLSVLFFAGVRVSEALAVTPEDVWYDNTTVYIQFHRLKGSKQTDPTPLPRTDALTYLCGLTEDPFPWSRSTGYRIVRRTFPDEGEGLYPHFFRQNRIIKIGEEFGDPTVYSFVGICAQSIDHYRGKVDIKKVGKSMWKEVQS